MTKEQEELRAHVQEKLRSLDKVIRHEVDERQAIQKNFSEFHEAVNAREKVIDAALNEKHDKDFTMLTAQIEHLEEALSCRLQ